MKSEQGQRIVYYKDNEERLAILAELRLLGFGCKNPTIDLKTSSQKAIDRYINDLPIGIDFEKREFFACNVLIAIYGKEIQISSADALNALKNNIPIKPHPSISII